MTTMPRIVISWKDTANATSFQSITLKTVVTHTVSYFVIGLLTFTLFDYRAKYADVMVAGSFRQMADPLVSAGPLFQVLRGFLFGIAFYALRETVFVPKRGWLTLWLVLLSVGIFSTFGAAPGSVEGFVYSKWPVWFQLVSLPELLLQSLVLAFVTHYWVNHPQNKWMSWGLGIFFVLVTLIAAMGLLAALKVLPTPR